MKGIAVTDRSSTAHSEPAKGEDGGRLVWNVSRGLSPILRDELEQILAKTSFVDSWRAMSSEQPFLLSAGNRDSGTAANVMIVDSAMNAKRLEDIVEVIKAAFENWDIVSQHDSTAFSRQVAGRDAETRSTTREQLSSELRTAFEVHPFENGIEHAAEEIIALASHNEWVFTWFRDFCTDMERPSFAASVLRCLGRDPRIGSEEWRCGLIQEALAIDDVEIRDAAIQAVESWGGKDLVEILRTHEEPEPWMRQYVEDVIADLGR